MRAGVAESVFDSLRAGWSADRVPVRTFSAPVQTGPGAYPASYKMNNRSFPEAKQPGRGVNNPPPSSAEVKERVELYLYSWPVTRTHFLYFFSILPSSE
jgi:hypothetical protein